MKKAKFIIFVLMVLLAGIVAVSVFVNVQGKKTGSEEEVAPKFSAQDAKMYLEKIHFVEDKRGKKTWELEAKSIQQNEDGNRMTLEDVKVTVYGDEGRSFIISGKEGKVFLDSKNLELVGDVTVTSSDGYRLKTHSIAYHHQEKKILSPDPVEIEGEQISVTGKGLQVDMEARTFRILNQVKTQWKWGGKG